MIVVKISDGLGNQMFQYAYARALKKKVKQSVYLDISDINRIPYRESEAGKLTRLCDMREYRLNQFQITLPVIDKSKISEIFKREYGGNKFIGYCRELRLTPAVYLDESAYGESCFRFSKWQNYYVEGFFFDKKHYEHNSGILSQEFQLKRRIKIPEKIQDILASRNTVSLHIRKGDFLKLGHDISGSDYYIRAMEYIQDKIENPFLLVFSDDIAWVKDNMKFMLDYLVISGQGYSDCEELILMSMCKNNIIANSTFSYWGAWLNPNEEKIVIAPRGWRQKIIPNTWVLL